MTLEQVTKELDMHFSRIDAILPELKSYLPLRVSDFKRLRRLKLLIFLSIVLQRFKIEWVRSYFPSS